MGDVRGAGYFYGIELVKDKESRETFDEEESSDCCVASSRRSLFDNGLYWPGG